MPGIYVKEIDANIHRAFRKACTLNGMEVREVLTMLIKKYAEDNCVFVRKENER